MAPIREKQLEELTKQPLLAVLSTVNPDGTPQATPVWYHYDGEAFVTTCFTHRIKVRNIRENPAVTLVVVDTVNADWDLIVRGTAELVEDGVPEATLKNAIRYLGEERGKKVAAELTAAGPRYMVKITPSRIFQTE